LRRKARIKIHQELDNAVPKHNRAAKSAVDAARATSKKGPTRPRLDGVQSPIDGIAGISITQVGDLVGEDTVLTTGIAVDPIKVSFPVSEQEYLRYADRLQIAGSDQLPREAKLELVLADR